MSGAVTHYMEATDRMRQRAERAEAEAKRLREQADDLRHALANIAEHARLDERERGFGEASRYYGIAEAALADPPARKEQS